MAIDAKLNAAWNMKLQEDGLFEFRAVAQNAYWQLMEAVSKIDAIVARPVFAGVDAELKTEGQAIRTIINNAKISLDAHTTFLNWTQPV